MSEYTPRAGSTAYLAMQHLQAYGRAGELALASAIDKETHELRALLGWAMKLGAISSEKVGDEWVYSPGDGVAVEKASTENTPQRGLTEMQARGEVMEPEGCASPTGRGGDAAPARAAGPASMSASQAGPASDGSQKPNGAGHSSSTAHARAGRNTPRRDSQHVLKAEAARPDATDREIPANASPVGGPMGAGQPAAAGPIDASGALRCRNAAWWLTGEVAIEATDGTVIVLDAVMARKLAMHLRPMVGGGV